MSDPRNNRASASAIERRFLCPGCVAAEAGLPEVATDWSDDGTQIHAALAGDTETLLKLSSENLATCQEMSEKATRLAVDLGFEPFNLRSEQRIWFGDEFSGQPDRVYIQGVRALVIDFKSGFLPVTKADSNPQMATLGVLVIHKYMVARVTVAIIPRFGKVKETAEYDVDSAQQALAFIRQIIADSEKPDAPRRAGDKQCKYCRAKLSCPEFQAFATSALTVPKSSLPTLSADKLALAIDRIPAANSLIKALKAEGDRRLDANDPDFSALYERSKGRNLRTIENLVELFARVRALGVDDADFTRACSLEIGAFESLIETATNLKGKALEKKCDELLSGLVDTQKSKGSLQRKE